MNELNITMKTVSIHCNSSFVLSPIKVQSSKLQVGEFLEIKERDSNRSENEFVELEPSMSFI